VRNQRLLGLRKTGLHAARRNASSRSQHTLRKARARTHRTRAASAAP